MITDAEFQAIIQDTSKRIEGDIIWYPDEDDSLAREFRVSVLTDNIGQFQLDGRYNPYAGTLIFALKRFGTGNIYVLNLGDFVYHNPTGETLTGTHKQHWTEEFKDKHAYIPPDITTEWHEPVRVWIQFCNESKITHNGRMFAPMDPGLQRGIV